MKHLFLFFSFVAATLLTSCASYQTTGDVVSSDIDVNAKVKMVLDLDNAKPIEATVTKTVICGIGSSTYKTTLDDGTTNLFGGKSKIKKQALAKAKKDYNVDVILEPEYIIESHSYILGLYRTKTCTVKGYGVKIKGFK